MRILSDSLKDLHGNSFRVVDAVQVNLRGRSVFVTENALDGTNGNIVPLHHGCARMSQRMKPEVLNPGFAAQCLHDSFAVLVRTGACFSGLAADVRVPKDPWLGRIWLAVS